MPPSVSVSCQFNIRFIFVPFPTQHHSVTLNWWIDSHSISPLSLCIILPSKVITQIHFPTVQHRRSKHDRLNPVYDATGSLEGPFSPWNMLEREDFSRVIKNPIVLPPLLPLHYDPSPTYCTCTLLLYYLASPVNMLQFSTIHGIMITLYQIIRVVGV